MKSSYFLLLLAVGCGEDAADPHGGPDGGIPPRSDAAPGTGSSSDDASAAADADIADVHAPDASVPADAAPTALPQNDGGDARLPPLVCDGPGSRYVTAVTSFEFGPGQDTGRDHFPEVVFGPPKGSGLLSGSFDVVSIGNGGIVVVEFDGNAIIDGPGPDFIVFENAFSAGGDPDSPFAELGTVAVSEDGVTWTEFPCTGTEFPYGHCAGWRPVYANPDENDIDPTDPEVAGGDPFDLADIGVATARFVRVTDRADLVGLDGVFDLDAVAIVHPLCP